MKLHKKPLRKNVRANCAQSSMATGPCTVLVHEQDHFAELFAGFEVGVSRRRSLLAQGALLRPNGATDAWD